MLTVAGGTGAIVEYFGPGAETHLSATGKATICNMGAEIGATTSLFAYDESMSRFLKATGREQVAADLADAAAEHLCGDPDDGVLADPEGCYDSGRRDRPRPRWRPHINGPHSPDRARPSVAELGDRGPRRRAGHMEISAALVGLVHELLLRGHHPCGQHR